jgi:integrase
MAGKRGRPRKEHGTTFIDDGFYCFCLGYEKPDGTKRWVKQSSGVKAGGNPAEDLRARRRAEEIRRRAQNTINASRDEFGIVGAEITVTQLIEKFAIERERLRVRTWKNERQRLVDYVLPEVGDMKVAEVRPRHLIEAYSRITTKTYTAGKPLSQKTIDETHRTLSLVFNYASVLELIPGGDNPCDQVGHRYRRATARRDPRRRTTGSYSVSEIGVLITHPSIPLYWRCLFAVEALAMTRAMEAGNLQFRDWRPSLANLGAPNGRRTLGELYVHGQKTETPRWVPVHPALSALLKEWKAKGFRNTFNRDPQPEDLMFPYVQKPGSRKAHGSPVTSKVIWKELQSTLARLGMLSPDQPRRPQHGLRRAGSSAMADEGVSEHDRRCITHAPDLSNMQERYDAPAWSRLSECVLKIQLPTVLNDQKETREIAPTPADYFSDFSRRNVEATAITDKTYLEAAGIEPASESLPSFDTTCVVRNLI